MPPNILIVHLTTLQEQAMIYRLADWRMRVSVVDRDFSVWHGISQFQKNDKVSQFWLWLTYRVKKLATPNLHDSIQKQIQL